MRFIAAVIVAVLAGVASADTPPEKPSPINATIDRGLAFLAKDAVAWKDKHNCVSCHHAALVVWSMREAKLRGYAVDEPLLAELTKWITTKGDGKSSLKRPERAPKGLNTGALYFSLALGADPAPDPVARESVKRFWKTLQGDQTENGSWQSWPNTRPPIFGHSDENMTALATFALLPAAAAGDEAAKAVRDKGLDWLAKTKSSDAQATALRLAILRRLDRPPNEWEPLVQMVKKRQNADGGWSQAKDMTSDAWATGQALYALAHAGIKSSDTVIARAHSFLIKAQRENGSWPMTSRPVEPGGTEGCKSLIPITGGGGAWAVLGLVRSR